MITFEEFKKCHIYPIYQKLNIKHLEDKELDEFIKDELYIEKLINIIISDRPRNFDENLKKYWDKLQEFKKKWKNYGGDHDD